MIFFRENSETLLVIGTGTLSPQLIAAHASVRPIKTVYVWGRSLAKSQSVCQKVSHLGLDCKAVEDLKEYKFLLHDFYYHHSN